jgi:pimeloyl-ACP methyl ester carboxylesterase
VTHAAGSPYLAVRAARDETRAVALVLPGGRAESVEPTTARQLAGVRMLPFSWSLHAAGAARGLAVWTLRYRVRGWNGEEMSPVADARWALDEARRHHPDVPIVLVGHSMGGRVAMRIADEPRVAGVAALAPWLPAGEPVEQLRGRRLLIAHGDADSVTSAEASQHFAARAADVAAAVEFVTFRRERHAMVLRWRTWHRLTTAFALEVVGLAPMPTHLRNVLVRGYA